jgi:hypothetical protein
VKYNENLLFATKGPSWPGTIAFIPGAYAANSLLGESTEFRRRTTNSSRPINRKTIEFERAVKTANAAPVAIPFARVRGRRQSRKPMV